MKRLTKEIIDAISAEMGIAPSYVEKDWYLVHILAIISSLNTEKIKAVFSGGTSLSKGYKVIRRFSEDVDFSITGLDNANRKERSRYKDELIKAINATGILRVKEDSIFSRDENRFANFYVDYPKEHPLKGSLRDGLKLELSFKTAHLKPVAKEIHAFAGQYLPDSPAVEMDCISLAETAANKFSALMWRVDIKDRSGKFNPMTNDPALMRHLHDLSALHPHVKNEADFAQLVKEIFETDKTRGNKTRDVTLPDFIKKTIAALKTDPLYKKEYEQYVSTMSYDLESEVGFDEALRDFEAMCKAFI